MTGHVTISEKVKPKLAGARDGVEKGDESELNETSDSVELMLAVRRNVDLPCEEMDNDAKGESGDGV